MGRTVMGQRTVAAVNDNATTLYVATVWLGMQFWSGLSFETLTTKVSHSAKGWIMERTNIRAELVIITNQTMVLCACVVTIRSRVMKNDSLEIQVTVEPINSAGTLRIPSLAISSLAWGKWRMSSVWKPRPYFVIQSPVTIKTDDRTWQC